ncbi:MAG: D-alanyl-D-alanine carboxypeptidase, partial [Eubacteriales bacterium]|nr:D-alanyl-D-alanine carboxypeptidase [Eubacteriales bacterium]
MRRLVLPMLLLTALLFGCLPVSAETVSAPTVSAQSAVLMDARYGLVLFEKDADRRLPMASTTKIM